MAGESVPNVDFRLNDSVRIRSGPLSGKVGAIVSLVCITPEPMYNVELGLDGSDHQLSQSKLERVD